MISLKNLNLSSGYGIYSDAKQKLAEASTSDINLLGACQVESAKQEAHAFSHGQFTPEPIQALNRIFQSLSIGATCTDYKQVNQCAIYLLQLRSNTRVKELHRYADEISLALKAPSKPTFKVVHPQGLVRMEFVAPRSSPLLLLDYFTNKCMPKLEIPVLLGQSIDGQPIWMDLAQNPHLLIAGTTGSGKSTLMHNLIANLLNYNEAELFLVDPKNIEFNKYEVRLPNTTVHFTYDTTICLLEDALEEMEARYRQLREGKSITSFRHQVIIIDEYADLIMQDRGDLFYSLLCRLAQKCRAARMHLIIATQRPSVNIVKGSIKANFPARIACRVATHIDSKVILDATGAEALMGKGDALLRDNTRCLERFQVAYISPEDVCEYWGTR